MDCYSALGEGNGTLQMTILVVRFDSIVFCGRNSKGRITQLGMANC